MDAHLVPNVKPRWSQTCLKSVLSVIISKHHDERKDYLQISFTGGLFQRPAARMILD